MFSRSIAENVSMGSEATLSSDEIRAACLTAAVDAEVRGFVMQYEEIIGERGIPLSGGQQQRLAIARALVRNARVLLLDDSFSSVDADTETHILSNLRTLIADRTVIVVSHRISALKVADRILVFEGGRITEEGSHDSLLTAGGFYARMAQYQQLEAVIR